MLLQELYLGFLDLAQLFSQPSLELNSKVIIATTKITLLTALFSGHTGSCCRSSSNTGVSCDVTGVAGVW